jgi:hypothetical protein
MIKQQVPNNFCKRIIKSDSAIRFVGVADKFGKIIAEEYRKKSVPLLSKEEVAMSVLQGAIRMGSRKTMIPKLGKLIYTVSYYEKVKRATMMLNNNNVLMVSFDPEANHDSILINKILPLVKDNGL